MTGAQQGFSHLTGNMLRQQISSFLHYVYLKVDIHTASMLLYGHTNGMFGGMILWLGISIQKKQLI